MSSIKIAVAAVGGPEALAAAISSSTKFRVSSQSIYAWINGRRRVPSKLCPTIERLTGVPCELLAPEVEWAYLRGTSRPPDLANTQPATPAPSDSDIATAAAGQGA